MIILDLEKIEIPHADDQIHLPSERVLISRAIGHALSGDELGFSGLEQNSHFASLPTSKYFPLVTPSASFSSSAVHNPNG